MPGYFASGETEAATRVQLCGPAGLREWSRADPPVSAFRPLFSLPNSSGEPEGGRDQLRPGFDLKQWEEKAPHERLPEILVVPREKTPTGAA